MAFFSRLSLAARLYSIFGLLAVLTAAVTVLSDYNSRHSAELTESIERANLAALNVERVNSLVYAVVMESRGVYMSTDSATAKKFGEGLLRFNDHILDVVKKWQGIVQADDAEQFATFKKRIEQFVEFRKELVRRANEISPAAGREWGDNDANRAVRSELNKDLEALSKVYVERGREIAERTETNRKLNSQVTADSEAREERTRHIEGSVEEFRQAIGAVLRNVNDNASAMRTVAQTISRVTSDANDRAVAASGATTQASSNVSAVASATEELSASVQEIGRQVKQSAGAVEQTGQRTEKSISEIESLAAATQRIDGVLQLIQAIAEQTNLLALNATIEAARAGDAGRGFAVVAHEVKALAGQTAKATEEIGQNVGMIQSSTKNAVDAVREIGGAVREINDITTAIAGAIGQQDAATREISANAQSAAEGNQTLVTNITSLRDAIGETNTAASSVLTASSELTATADTLSREVEKFFHNLRGGRKVA